MKHSITCNTFLFKHRFSLSLLLIILLFSIACQPSFAIVDWKRGTGTAGILGGDNASDIDYDATNYLQDPLDRLLYNYIHGCTLTWASNSTITIGIGEVTCSNGAGTIKRMRQNTATATLDMTTVGVGGIDSGSHAGTEQASTWYSLYAVADASATTFTVIAAEQGVALSDVTYYRYIGSVYNNATSNIDKFFCNGTGNSVLTMWDVPVVVTTTVSSSAWSAAISCSTGMPNTTILGIFGLAQVHNNDGRGVVTIRPNGSTWDTENSDGIGGGGSAAAGGFGGQKTCFTDSSQQIQLYNYAVGGVTSTRITVQGFYINR